WFFEAWRTYFDATKDIAALRAAFPVLSDMIEWHRKGTRYGIAVDADGLLKAGVAGVQLTWMDAKIGDWVVTPGIGKPVESNALWYNALCIMNEFAGVLREPDRFSASAEAGKQSFARFVRADGEGLYDVIDGPDGNDASIRPNQIFAVSLPHSPLGASDQANVVRACRRHLFTAYGLRSLARRQFGVPCAVGRRSVGTRRRLPSRAGLAVATRTVLSCELSRHRRCKGGASFAGGVERRARGSGGGHDRRDFRRRSPAPAARRARAGLVRRLHARCLALAARCRACPFDWAHERSLGDDHRCRKSLTPNGNASSKAATAQRTGGAGAPT